MALVQPDRVLPYQTGPGRPVFSLLILVPEFTVAMVICAGAAVERKWLGKRPGSHGVEEEEPFGPSRVPHPYTDQKDNRKSSRLPKGLTLV